MGKYSKTSSKFPFRWSLKTLYTKSFNGVLLLCLSQQEANESLKKLHSDLCGAHPASLKFYDLVKRFGYYWPTTVAIAIQYASTTNKDKVHEDCVHLPPEWLHPITISSPFEACGMDIIGPIFPLSSKGHSSSQPPRITSPRAQNHLISVKWEPHQSCAQMLFVVMAYLKDSSIITNNNYKIQSCHSILQQTYWQKLSTK